MATNTPNLDDLALIPLKRVSERLHLSMTTVYLLCDSGRLPSVYQGTRRYVTAAGLRDYIASLPTTPEAS